jgi:hypothetical protein
MGAGAAARLRDLALVAHGLVVAPLALVPIGPLTEARQRLGRLDDAQGLGHLDLGILPAIVRAHADRVAPAGTGAGEVVALHSRVVHVQLGLGVIDRVPGGQGGLLALILPGLDQGLLLLLVGLLVLPHVPAPGRLQQSLEAAVHVAAEVAAVVLMAKLAIGARVEGVERYPWHQVQPLGLDILAAMSIFEPLQPTFRASPATISRFPQSSG